MDNLLLNTKKDGSPVLQIQSIELTLNPISLFIFQEIPFHFNTYGGQIDGHLGIFPTLYSEFEARNIQLNRNRLIRKTNLVISNPILQVEGKLTLSPPVNGQIKLNLQSLILSGKTEDTNLPFELPPMDIEYLNANLMFRENQVRVLAKSKGDISGSIQGTIQVNISDFQRSRLDLKMTTTLNKDYQEQLGIFAAIISSYKNKAGQISIKLTGSPQYPKINKI